MIKKWELYEHRETKEELEQLKEQISNEFNISKLLAGVLVNRGLVQSEQIQVFLNPTRNDFHDPMLLPDMEKAVQRILKAIQQKEKIVIYGDYDVDGITSITVLKKFLTERGICVQEYIPNRLDEGYGLNKEAIKTIYEQQNQLMITVDCGISGIEEIDYANRLGMEVIVTDHHEPLEELPKGVAVIDPKRKDSRYPFRGLAGVGVVFKLIQALGRVLQLEEKEYLKYLDLVCVGTISDIVPLVDENRVITKLGLRLVEKTKNIGLRELIKASGFQAIDSNTISFGIAPRINACGRMGHQEEALELFLTQEEEQAKQITEHLNNYNKQRQDTEKRIFEQAIGKIEEQPESPCIVLGDDSWHHGVIGIVSSKVTDMYFKPSILICFEGEEGKGSGRSIPGFDLHEALGKCSTYLEKYGGHEMAVGVSLKKHNFDAFRKQFEEIVKQSNIQDLLPVIYVDEQICLKNLDISFVKELQLLQPFGEGNKVPLFLFRNVKIDSIRSLSEGKHLRLTLREDSAIMNAIGFNLGELAEEYHIGDKIDAVGVLEINTFNGKDSIQLNLKDIRKAY